MLASQIPLKQADTKLQFCSPWGAKAMTEKKEITPPKCRHAALEYDTPCARCGWVFGSKVRRELSSSGAFTADCDWALAYLGPELTLQPSPHFALHAKLTQTLVADVALAQCGLLMFNRCFCTQWSLWHQGTNVYDSTLQTEILDVATSQQEETSEECVFLIFLLPEKWRVLSVWLTSMFFTCDIFKLWDPALIGMQKVWLFSRPTPKGLSARDRWQQELGVGHLQVYNGGRNLKRSSFRIEECQPYVKA